MIHVSVKLFAAARESVGAGETTVSLPDGATVGDVRSALREKHPQIEPLLEHAMFAVDAGLRGRSDSCAAPLRDRLHSARQRRLEIQ